MVIILASVVRCVRRRQRRPQNEEATLAPFWNQPSVGDARHYQHSPPRYERSPASEKIIAMPSMPQSMYQPTMDYSSYRRQHFEYDITAAAAKKKVVRWAWFAA